MRIGTGRIAGATARGVEQIGNRDHARQRLLDAAQQARRAHRIAGIEAQLCGAQAQRGGFAGVAEQRRALVERGRGIRDVLAASGGEHERDRAAWIVERRRGLAEDRVDARWIIVSETSEGDLMSGSGTIVSSGSGALSNLDVNWKARTESSDGSTSPEELIAAAHASCFSMALSHGLAQAGSPAEL